MANNSLNLLSHAGDHLCDTILENIVDIFANTKDDIIDVLKTIDEHQLITSRDCLFDVLVLLFPEFSCSALIARRKKKLLAEDIYVIGYCVVNNQKDKRLSNILKAEPENTSLTIEENEESDITQALNSCVPIKLVTNELSSTVKDLLSRIQHLEEEVTSLKLKLAAESQRNKPVVNLNREVVDLTDVKEQFEHTKDRRFVDESTDIIQSVEENDAVGPELILNRVLVQAEVHADVNGNTSQVTDSFDKTEFHHKNTERQKIKRGRAGTKQTYKASIQGASKEFCKISNITGTKTQTQLIYIGGLARNTSESDLRSHLLQIGVVNNDIADVIKLHCKTSFCLSLNQNPKAQTIVFSEKNWPTGSRIRQYYPPRSRRLLHQ